MFPQNENICQRLGLDLSNVWIQELQQHPSQAQPSSQHPQTLSFEDPHITSFAEPRITSAGLEFCRSSAALENQTTSESLPGMEHQPTISSSSWCRKTLGPVLEIQDTFQDWQTWIWITLIQLRIKVTSLFFLLITLPSILQSLWCTPELTPTCRLSCWLSYDKRSRKIQRPIHIKKSWLWSRKNI